MNGAIDVIDDFERFTRGFDGFIVPLQAVEDLRHLLQGASDVGVISTERFALETQRFTQLFESLDSPSLVHQDRSELQPSRRPRDRFQRVVPVETSRCFEEHLLGLDGICIAVDEPSFDDHRLNGVEAVMAGGFREADDGVGDFGSRLGEATFGVEELGNGC